MLDDAIPVAPSEELPSGDIPLAPLEPVEEYEPEVIERVEAPVAELIPIIRVGDWVRLEGRGVPRRLINATARVTAAVIHSAQGMDSISDTPYEYQEKGDVFSVYVRATGDALIDLTRASFVSFGPTEAEVDRYTR